MRDESEDTAGDRDCCRLLRSTRGETKRGTERERETERVCVCDRKRDQCMCVCMLCVHAHDCVCVWCDGCVSVHVFVGEGFNNLQARTQEPRLRVCRFEEEGHKPGGCECKVAGQSMQTSTVMRMGPWQGMMMSAHHLSRKSPGDSNPGVSDMGGMLNYMRATPQYRKP
jgi:hypothetical protein